MASRFLGKSENKRFVFVATFIVGIFVTIILIRIPFLSNVLVDEEGIFAYIVSGSTPVVSTKTSKAIILARIKGRDIFGIPEHPIFPYLFMDRVLRHLYREIDPLTLPMIKKTRQARIPFLVTYSVGLLLLFAVGAWLFKVTDYSTLFLPLSLIVFVTTTPLMVGGSIQPQVDGSIGVMLIGVTAFLMTRKQNKTIGSAAVLISAGVVSAIGKNEWAIALFGAALASLFVFVYFRRRYGYYGLTYQLSPFVGTLLLIAGIAIGSVWSYILSPENYWGGIRVMERLSSNNTVSLKQTIAHNISWIWPFFVLVVLSTVLITTKFRVIIEKQFALIALYCWGLALGIGFLFVPWGGDGFPRYYLPSMFALLCLVISILEHIHIERRYLHATSIALLIGIVTNWSMLYSANSNGVAISSAPGTSLKNKTEQLFKSYNNYKNTGEPAIIDAAFGYYFRDADFVGQALGEEGIRRLLLKYKNSQIEVQKSPR